MGLDPETSSSIGGRFVRILRDLPTSQQALNQGILGPKRGVVDPTNTIDGVQIHGLVNFCREICLIIPWINYITIGEYHRWWNPWQNIKISKYGAKYVAWFFFFNLGSLQQIDEIPVGKPRNKSYRNYHSQTSIQTNTPKNTTNFLCVPHIRALDTHQGLLHLVVNTSLHRVNDVFAGLHRPLYLASRGQGHYQRQPSQFFASDPSVGSNWTYCIMMVVISMIIELLNRNMKPDVKRFFKTFLPLRRGIDSHDIISKPTNGIIQYLKWWCCQNKKSARKSKRSFVT